MLQELAQIWHKLPGQSEGDVSGRLEGAASVDASARVSLPDASSVASSTTRIDRRSWNL